MSNVDRDDELRDTGRNPKIPDEVKHMSNARIFDTLVASNVTLVASNVTLVRTLKIAITVMVGFGLVATTMTMFSALILRMGQQETRELIIAIGSGRKDCFQLQPGAKTIQKD